MAQLTIEQMLDLAAGTTERFGKGRFTQIWQNIVKFEVLPRLLKKDKIVFDGGDFVRFNLMTTVDDNARMVGLGDVDNPNIPAAMTHGRADWRFTTWHWAWERREALFQRGAHKIWDVIKVRKAIGMGSLAKLMEEQFFGTPTSSTNTLDVLGIFHWVPKATALTEGFNGGIPSGFTDVAGLDPTTINYSAYNAGYTDISDADLLEKVRTSYYSTDFESPIDGGDYRNGRGQTMRHYTNKTVHQKLTAIARGQNDNLAGELFAYRNGVTFNGNAVQRIAQLDADTSNPWLCLNFDTIDLAVLDGDYMTETPAMRVPGVHNMIAGYGDITWCLYCRDRRRNACFNQI